ncbi:MAG: methylenetetrahydrofolate reductase [Lachnospira eligens]
MLSGSIPIPPAEEDILGLKRKVEAGCEYLTTQMFFDNNIFFTCTEERQVSQFPLFQNHAYHKESQVKCSEISGCNVPGVSRTS